VDHDRPVRILITGSRLWSDKHTVGNALTWAIGQFPHLTLTGGVGGYPGPTCRWDRVTVVHGAARGADTIAARIAAVWGMRVEAHPAEWGTCGLECQPVHRRVRWDGSAYCPTAGHRRNQHMVDRGADLCLGFPSRPGQCGQKGPRSGTRDCMSRAVKAGIRVVDWPVEGAALMAAAGLRVTS
jgi:hypothetical protein